MKILIYYHCDSLYGHAESVDKYNSTILELHEKPVLEGPFKLFRPSKYIVENIC
jgi:hypothetical protein